MVLAVNGSTAITNEGLVRLSHGHHARPGQNITVACDSLISLGATTQHRARPQARTDDAPFVPTPSFDSPQRPARFGSIHFPQTDEAGVFLGEQYTLPLTAPQSITVTLDDGAARSVNQPLRIDHHARFLTWDQSGGVRNESPTASQAAYYPFDLGERLYLGWRITPTNITTGAGGTVDYFTTHTFLSYDGTTSEIVEAIGSADITRTLGDVALHYQDGGNDQAFSVTGYAVKEQWEIGQVEPTRYRRFRTLVAQLPDSTPNPFDSSQYVALLPTDVSPFQTAEQWGADLPDDAGLHSIRYTAVILQSVADGDGPEVGTPSGQRWTSPLESVTVSGPFNFDAADLTDATLTAFGHSFSGGTWAGLSDGQGGAIVLHESGGVVSAVTPLGVQTTSRLTFETEILRATPGTFLRFNRIGTGFNSWPPEWAFATCAVGGGKGQNRALIAFDPWRDSVKQAAPGQPASWAWPGRPGKRPAIKPALPRPPLPLALADVLGAVEVDEPLRRGQAPWRLPTVAEVPVGGNWAVSPGALSVLAKRALYPPANWPEELLDRNPLQGPIRLTFGEI